MHCPRLEHYVRLNSNGTIGNCGHMTSQQHYNSLQEMHNSNWHKNIVDTMKNNIWPNECTRCKQTEELNNFSIRLNSIKRDKILRSINKNYLQVAGTLDNYCNAACVSCSSSLSTTIGKLKKDLVVKNNFDLYKTLPQDRIIEIDINGGEPSISVNYNKLLDDITSNVKVIRINTNANRRIKQLVNLLEKGITVIVTVSFDGIEEVHEYMRYPIKWKTFESNLMYYQEMQLSWTNMYLDTWTTVSCLNVGHLQQIQDFCKMHNIRHEFAFLNKPDPLNVKYKNWFTEKVNMKGVGVDKDNTEELENFLELEEKCRPNIKKFW